MCEVGTVGCRLSVAEKGGISTSMNFVWLLQNMLALRNNFYKLLFRGTRYDLREDLR